MDDLLKAAVKTSQEQIMADMNIDKINALIDLTGI